MIGLKLIHKLSGVSGFVDAVTVHPDGVALARINDHWFDVVELSGCKE